MKPSVLVGIVLAAVIVAAGIVVPRLPSPRKTSTEAQAQAAVAARKLARVSLMLPRVQHLANVEDLRGAELEALVQDARETLQDIGSRGTQAARRAQQAAQQAGLPAPQIQPVGASAGSVRQALGELESLFRDNAALLNEAVQDAQAATNIDANAVGVAQVAGMADYVKAARLLNEAQQRRREQTRLQADLIDLATEYQLARGWAEHYTGRDVTTILPGLEADEQELERLRQAAEQTQETLAAQVNAREQALVAVNEQLADVRNQLFELERAGFTAGDDASFETYRTRYLDLTSRLRELEARQQLLELGGLQGAEFMGRDVQTAEIRGGEPMLGLAELRRRLEIAQESFRRLSDAVDALQQHLQQVVSESRQASTQAGVYQTRVTELEGRLKTLQDEVLAAYSEVAQAEDQALQAARSATRNFSQAQRALESWLRDAQTLRRERDPVGANERLRILTSDPYLEQVGRTAEAASHLLTGRIHALRMERTQQLLRDLDLLQEMGVELSVDTQPVEANVASSREEGLAAADRARDLYSQARSALGAEPTEWVPRAALATAQHLAWRLDPQRTTQIDGGATGTYRDAARHTVGLAIEQREQSPYLRPFVRFAAHLDRASGEAGQPPAPAAPAGDDFFGDGAAEEEPAGDEEEDDFFGGD